MDSSLDIIRRDTRHLLPGPRARTIGEQIGDEVHAPAYLGVANPAALLKAGGLGITLKRLAEKQAALEEDRGTAGRSPLLQALVQACVAAEDCLRRGAVKIEGTGTRSPYLPSTERKREPSFSLRHQDLVYGSVQPTPWLTTHELCQKRQFENTNPIPPGNAPPHFSYVYFFNEPRVVITTTGVTDIFQPRRRLLRHLHGNLAFAAELDLDDTGEQRWPDKSLQTSPYCLSTGRSRAVIAKSKEDLAGKLHATNVLAINGRHAAKAGGEIFRFVNIEVLRWP